MEFRVVKGKDLQEDELELINRYKQKYFKSKSVMTPTPDNEYWEKRHCLVFDEDQLVAFGRLHDQIWVEVDGEKYWVTGFATIMAFEQGMGHGRYLVESMMKYLEDNGELAMGFSANDMADYYEKCGCVAIRETGDRYVFEEKEGRLVRSEYGNNAALFYPDVSELLEAIRNSDGLVFLGREHW